MEAIIKEKLENIIQAVFDDMHRDISVQRAPDGSYKVHITSDDPDFLGGIIGKGGATIAALKALFNVVEKRNNIRVSIWVEKFATHYAR